MSALTADTYWAALRWHIGECHTAWCITHTCNGECARTATLTAIDGRPVDLTIVFPADADEPTITVAARDGHPYQLSASEGRRAANLAAQWLDPTGIPARGLRPISAGGAR